MGYFWSLLDRHTGTGSARTNSPMDWMQATPPNTTRRTAYFTAMAPTMDAKTLNPSVPPNSASLERSG